MTLPGLAAALPVLLHLAGGLALFLHGLREMSAGLRHLAGGRLRALLQLATRRPLGGYALGGALGFLLHSSGATVMLVGFLNAGLVSLPEALPVVFGANLGTSLAMQAVSFKLTGLAYPALVLGLLLGFRDGPPRAAGRALLGFGLLFLGLDVMGSSVFPYRETLRPLLTRLDGSTLPGMLGGILLSLLFTAIVQSSGATIGIAFALSRAGVLVSLAQTAPLILGAHIGTCLTAGIASLGGQPAARRAALAHLLFNFLNVTLAILLRGPLLAAVAATSPDLVRQSANLHTVVMLAAGLLLLPLSRPFTRLIERLSPSRGPEPDPSHLDPEALAHAHSALPAVRREFIRLLALASESLELNRRLLEAPSPAASRRIRAIEDIVDSIKITMIAGLRQLARTADTPRASLTSIGQWTRCMIEMERIADHLNTLRKLSEQRSREPGHILFGRELTHRLNHLFTLTSSLLDQLASLLAETEPSALPSRLDALLRDRVNLLDLTQQALRLFQRRMDDNRLQPRVMFYFSSYLEVFERLARHAHILATTSPGS